MPDILDSFDLDDPELPKAIKKGAMESGGYPYEDKLKWKHYLDRIETLQKQLVKLQAHMLKAGERIVMVFEGRDSAGKGGAIKTYLANLNPRYNIHVALPAPNNRESAQWYFQRYVDYLPAGKETVLYDRSWYNRAGVEPVMGFCTREQTAHFLQQAPKFERMIVDDGIHLVKFYLSIGREMQMKRFHDRRHDPLKEWKLSPVDLKALSHWTDYTMARNTMLQATDTEVAPWTLIMANDKRRARIAVMQTVLQAMDFEGKDGVAIGNIDKKVVLSAKEFLKEHVAD